MGSLDNFGFECPEVDDSIEGSFARERLDEVSSRPYEMLRPPSTYDEALELVLQQFGRLSVISGEVKVGIRECCITGEVVLMVWVPGNIQCHIPLKDMLDDFDVDQFREDVNEHLDTEPVLLDEYLIED